MKARASLLGAVLVGAALLALPGCAAGGSELEDTSWVVVLDDAPEDADSLLGPTEIRIKFSSASQGTVTGSYALNKYEGHYEVDGDSLTITDVCWTTMACQAEGGMDDEQQYLFTLMEAEGYAIEGDTMTIDAGGEVLVFGRG